MYVIQDVAVLKLNYEFRISKDTAFFGNLLANALFKRYGLLKLLNYRNE